MIHRIFSLLLFISTFSITSAQVIPFTSEAWTYKSKSHILEHFEGYPSLYLQSGMAYLEGEQFKNGVIEFDMYHTERVSFSGFLFRMLDTRNYEEVYFRSHLSAEPDAYQYMPKSQGNSSWQLYHDRYTRRPGQPAWIPADEGMGYNSVIEFPMDAWIHIKVVVSGTQAVIYLDHEQTPSMVIQKLKRDVIAGPAGLLSSGGAIHFANFQVRHIDDPILPNFKMVETKIDPNIIDIWNISSVFKESRLLTRTDIPQDLSNNLQWHSMSSESTGLVNISALRSRENRESTVLVQVQLYSDRAQVKKLTFGYSDRARLYLNNAVIYSGNNAYRSRDHRYLGIIGYFDSVYLYLKEGQNDLTIAVSETSFGWGVQARLEDMEGVEVKVE